ncbi:murein L,D-transpeptidase catalytic domain family protein [Bacteroidales bacterium OttesenSCG-928-L03]|nr:murein L,D-transpeptidase catalytic domain family protein [Bacteroidales bacterium OttesenSCG-928-L03]
MTMRNITPYLLLLFSFVFAGVQTIVRNQCRVSEDGKTEFLIQLPKYYSLYQGLGLEDEVSYAAFDQAMTGYEKIEKKKPILTLIDFSKPSVDERLYVIDVENKEVLYRSVVAHGRNSGANYTTSFSNKPGSHQSSLGFFLTERSYQGGNGYSLVIDGVEPGINDNAKKRAVVIHGADYANPKLARSAGRLGRSWGCPALPRSLTKPIIDKIKGGSVIYAYCKSHNEDYLKRSSVLRAYRFPSPESTELLTQSNYSSLPLSGTESPGTYR